ncbi:MAG: sigma-70 family RNA polymerase sigma factor [Planctomycetaceae bacterium]
MELPLEEFEKLKSEALAVGLVSLNKKWYETDSYKDVREVDILEDGKGEDPTNGIQKRDLMRLVTKGLNRNERLIMILYYYEELTMKEIGTTLGLSESRVSQMHSSIVNRLKDQLKQSARNSPDLAPRVARGPCFRQMERQGAEHFSSLPFFAFFSENALASIASLVHGAAGVLLRK